MKITFGKLTMIFTLILCCAGFAFAQTERDKGIELYEKGDYKAAAETLQKSVETDDKNQELWLYLGMSFVKLKEAKKAGKAFREANKLLPQKMAENEKDLEITAKPRASYTDLARMNQVTGTVFFAIEFGADGESKNAFVFQGLPHGLTETSIEAAKKIKFNSATRDGKPVLRIKIIRYNFQLY